jgi:hypothetical protein
MSMNNVVPSFMLLSRAGDILLKERDAVDHRYVPEGQPSEWPIPMDEKAWAAADPAAPSENANYTTNSQNRGGFC